MDFILQRFLSILAIANDYLSRQHVTINLEGRSHEISAPVLPR